MSTEDQPSVLNNLEKRRFEAQIGGLVALAEYRLDGNIMTFTHTEVPDAFKGRGVGAQLVKAGLDYAREQGYRVVPQCPFVAQYIHRHSQYADLVSR